MSVIVAADHLVDVYEAARRLGIPKRAMYGLVEMQRITVYRVGRRLRFDPKDLDEYLAGVRTDAAA